MIKTVILRSMLFIAALLGCMRADAESFVGQIAWNAVGVTTTTTQGVTANDSAVFVMVSPVSNVAHLFTVETLSRQISSRAVSQVISVIDDLSGIEIYHGVGVNQRFWIWSEPYRPYTMFVYGAPRNADMIVTVRKW